MPDVNQVILIGRLVRDAELKYTAPISQLAANEKLSGILSFISTAGACGFGELINRPALAVYLANAMRVPMELLGGAEGE